MFGPPVVSRSYCLVLRIVSSDSEKYRYNHIGQVHMTNNSEQIINRDKNEFLFSAQRPRFLYS